MFAYDYSCKLVLVGECSVGKTALTQRLVYDMFNKKMDATITNVGYCRSRKFY